MYHNFIFDILADGHVDCLHFLTILNTVAMNMDTAKFRVFEVYAQE